MLKSRLPPLDNLVAFEAAARRLSFTRAADELNITQAAVSQQIRNLETRLGVKLFDRAHRAVSLTAAGREYQHTVSAALRHLASATGDIRLSETSPRLTIACDQSIAALCLVPQLTAFRARHPDIALRLIASDTMADCLVDEVQVAVLHGTGDWPGYSSELLFREEVFPVCSAEYLRGTGGIADLAALARCDLINLDDEQWDWMNWRVWFTSMGIDLPFEQRNLQINNYPLLIEAAKKGHGVALGWRWLVDAALANGTLVKPLDDTVVSDFAYYLVWPERSAPGKEALAFCHWMRAMLGTSNNLHG